MKVLNKISWMLGLMLVASMTFMSCTKEGPAGLPGTDGKDGKDGEDGINGQDGTATCVTCHDNTQTLSSRTMQWEASTHATGGNYNRNTGECATCHTSQGYRGLLAGTYDPAATGAIINNPNPPNCYTCHKIHENYTPGDLELTFSGAVALNNTTESFDFGVSSQCASCHQGRVVSNFAQIGGPDVTVTNTRYHVHYGSQSNIISGIGLYNIGEGLSNSLHTTMITDQCISCHMTGGTAGQSGGHTFKMRNLSNGLNTAGCVSCHTDAAALTADIAALKTQVTDLLTELKSKLDAKGITAPGSDNSVAGTYPANVAGAMINYKGVLYDGSYGVHNPTYTIKLLQNSIAAIE